MVVTRYGAEAAEALRPPYEAGEILTNLNYDPVIGEWHWDWQNFEGPADARIWMLKICAWLQYKYPDGPVW
jgi:hypothetical protein